ncbi:ISAs1 family transposase [Burkholderia stabilis]|uniref:Transposase n=1 Tax=Burkholderia stabilis TaxID=95485 RepID=A0A1Y1BM71_9BURK|nr:ISAs1 family transposase [Burkholderia stabilis]BAX60971.1 transposase [Burkholderia stabilis]
MRQSILQQDVLSIEEAFGGLTDPRSRPSPHDLREILLVSLCAILSGADSWVAIQIWGESKLDWLRRYVPLEHGIPSHDTFGRVFAALDPLEFEACFVRWMRGLCPALADEVVAIDGKTVRGSRSANQPGIHLVSAWASQMGMSLGQVRTADKSNEITAIPALLDILLLKGAIVTLDAMGCQRQIAERIVKAGGDYVLAVKDNQPTLLERVRYALEAIERVPHAYRDHTTEHQDIDKDHGRIETRWCIASDVLACGAHEPGLWPGLRSIVMVEATREMGDTKATERRYYVSSLPADAARIAQAVWAHWRIENSMHWVLDMAFGEDRCRARVNNAAQNFAILRRTCLNLLKADTTTKAGIKNRRLKTGASDDYRASILRL